MMVIYNILSYEKRKAVTCNCKSEQLTTIFRTEYSHLQTIVLLHRRVRLLLRWKILPLTLLMYKTE
jgi:hypothetical protein